MIVEGGTGYETKHVLPPMIEHIMPDYSLYPQHEEAYGFLSRGCPRKCKFCIVSEKEGCQSIKVADLSEFYAGQKTIKLLDPNILACKERESLLEQLVRSKAWVDFTQGIDIRLIDREIIRIINKLKVKMIHFAWDNPSEDLIKNFEMFDKYSCIRDYRKRGVYVLANFNTTLQEDLYRIYKLRELNFDPYVMIFDKENASKEKRYLQRWVNNKRIFRSCMKFEEYDYKRG